MKIITVLFVMLVSGISIFAVQNPPPTPPPTPYPTPDRQAEMQRIREMRQRNAEFERMRAMNAEAGKPRPRPGASPGEIAALYRKSTGKELALLAPDPEDFRYYQDFLKQSGTGLIRLTPDLGCSNTTTVVSASAECLKFSMPGGGNSYSFRKRDYRISRLADLTFSSGRFKTSGILTHGILVNLGNVDIEAVSLKSVGLKYLVNFMPIADLADARGIEDKLLAGLTSDGFKYASSLAAVENMTYVLRSVAYNGDLYRAVKGSVYDEFDFDTRADVILAFRFVRMREDGSITILWKELAREKSPRIKLPKKPETQKITENSFLTTAGR